MHKTITSCLVVAALIAICSTSAFAQATKTQDNKAKTTTQTPAKTTTQTSATKTVKPAAKPVTSPGWVVIEEEWFTPQWYSFSDSLHNARKHYRAQQEKAAAAEIDKAASWLKYAENHADKSYAGELLTVRTDLMDFAIRLRNGGNVKAGALSSAFANASKALAKHHHFQSSKALAEGDMKTAGKHLMAAVDHVRNAANSANHEYGKEIVDIYDHYSPFGYWDETITIEKSMLEKNLTSIKTELDKMATKLGAKR